MAVGQWGIQPGHFWEMTPQEWWIIHKQKRPKEERSISLSEAELDELYDLIQ
ncbi:phage tail assembly chaperone [Advenella sp. WQ 585]|uniref:Phage tail assembly chaperone n=1 Tax=Advenella mandrilli TaxID=2800330 RepID=A0ABS1EBY4_9BURK|nr:phage tail assembly chaperone [Advenella mandrilli]